MRRTITLAIGALLLLSMVIAPLAAAEHRVRTDTRSYVTGSDADALLPLFFLHPDGRRGDLVYFCQDTIPINVGAVCFDLVGNEHKINLHIADRGQTEMRRTDNEVDQTLDGTLGSAPNVASFGFTSGFYQIEDESGSVRAHGTFCGSATDIIVPADGARVKVFLDDAWFGTDALGGSPCGMTTSTATLGEVVLAVVEDP